MCIQNLVKFFPFILKILSKNLILPSIKCFNSVANLGKMACNNSNINLVNLDRIHNLVKLCPFILKILSKNQILISTKERYSVANLQKMALYNPDIDHVNINVYTKFGLILSI